jgi:hypothetical protein
MHNWADAIVIKGKKVVLTSLIQSYRITQSYR